MLAGLVDVLAGAVQVEIDRERLGDADGIGHLDGAALGDVRLSGRVRLLGDASDGTATRADGPGLAGMLTVTLPTAQGGGFHGTDLPEIDVVAIADFHILNLGIGASLGARIRPEKVLLAGQRHGSELHWGLGIALPPVVRTVDPADVTGPDGDYVMAYAHNVVNGALAAVAAAEVIGRPVTEDEFLGAVTTFEALPHRLQVVRRTGGVRWINDTLATTGESVVAALRSMRPEDRVALIVGGMDRQLDYEQVDDYLLSGARDVYLIQGPTNGTDIGRRFAVAHPESVRAVDSLEAAVRTAASVPGVTAVLLSPGAASYDLFANYVAKAAAFCEFIDAGIDASDAVGQSN